MYAHYAQVKALDEEEELSECSFKVPSLPNTLQVSKLRRCPCSLFLLYKGIIVLIL
jgi:hypothetical protein